MFVLSCKLWRGKPIPNIQSALQFKRLSLKQLPLNNPKRSPESNRIRTHLGDLGLQRYTLPHQNHDGAVCAGRIDVLRRRDLQSGVGE